MSVRRKVPAQNKTIKPRNPDYALAVKLSAISRETQFILCNTRKLRLIVVFLRLHVSFLMKFIRICPLTHRYFVDKIDPDLLLKQQNFQILPANRSLARWVPSL